METLEEKDNIQEENPTTWFVWTMTDSAYHEFCAIHCFAYLSIYIYFQMGLHSNLQLWVITNIKEICAMFCCRMDAANHRVFVDSPSLEQPM